MCRLPLTLATPVARLSQPLLSTADPVLTISRQLYPFAVLLAKRQESKGTSIHNPQTNGSRLNMAVL